MTHDGYFLVAHCVNATDAQRAEVEWEVAAQGIDGRWYTNDTREVWPFHIQPINDPTPPIPDGWIDHLHDIARQQFRPPSLSDILGLSTARRSAVPTAPIKRRF